MLRAQHPKQVSTAEYGISCGDGSRKFIISAGWSFTIPYVPIYIAGVYERCVVGKRSVQ